MRASGLALVAALPLLAAPSSAHADVRIGIGVTLGPSYRPTGYGRRPLPTFRYGYDRGYTEGARDGFHDGERGRRFELYREDDYRDADQGYRGWMGLRYEYANGYRSGYEEGYRKSFREGRERCDRNGRHGRDDDGRIYELPRRRY
jgi:hypothetical protein